MILDFIFSLIGLIFVAWMVWEKFKSHPSDKYHNDSWRTRKK